MTRRGIRLATASVVPTTEKPAFSNIERVPTNAIVVSIRPFGSTGCASTAGAPFDARRSRPHPRAGAHHALAAVAAAHDEADDAPDRHVVGRPDQLRVLQPRDLRARADVAPADRRAVEVGHDARRVLALAQRAHRLLAARPVAAELADLGGVTRCDRHQHESARRLGLMTSAKSSNRSGVTGCVSQRCSPDPRSRPEPSGHVPANHAPDTRQPTGAHPPIPTSCDCPRFSHPAPVERAKSHEVGAQRCHTAGPSGV